jgi:hypothetical protein
MAGNFFLGVAGCLGSAAMGATESSSSMPESRGSSLALAAELRKGAIVAEKEGLCFSATDASSAASLIEFLAVLLASSDWVEPGDKPKASSARASTDRVS